MNGWAVSERFATLTPDYMITTEWPRVAKTTRFLKHLRELVRRYNIAEQAGVLLMVSLFVLIVAWAGQNDLMAYQ